MKFTKFLMAALVLTAAVSCKPKDPVDDPNASVPEEMTLTVQAPAFSGLDFAWEAGDQISVFDGKKNNSFKADGAGASASFSGTANSKATDFYGYYPATTAERYSGKVPANVPAYQTAVAGGVERSLFIASAHNSADAKALNFSPVLSYVKVDLTAAAADVANLVSVSLKANGGETLAGDVLVGLSEPTVEPNASKTQYSSVALSGDNLTGVYYLAVVPQNLAQGYTLSFTDSEDSYAEFKVETATEFAAGAVTTVAATGSLDWQPAVNPNPSSIDAIKVFKVAFEEDDFNMVTDPDMSSYLTRGKSPWYNEFLTVEPYEAEGHSYIKYTSFRDGWNWSRLFQVVHLKANTEFEFSFIGNSNRDAWTGCECWEDYHNEEPVPMDWVEAAPQWNPSEKLVSKVFQSGNSYFCDLHMGLWGDPGDGCYFRNLTLKPVGYDKKSTKVKSVEPMNGFKNTTFDAINSLERIATWTDGDDVKIAFAKTDVAGGVVDNFVGICMDADINNLAVNKYMKMGGRITPMFNVPDGAFSVVPDAAINVNGKTYVHCYVETGAGFQRDDVFYQRDIATSGFVTSEDGGKTWTLPTKTFDKYAYNDGYPYIYSHFEQVSLTEKDGVVYMVGTPAGRFANVLGWVENKRTFFAARCNADLDLANPDNWQYWTGFDWSSNVADINIRGTLSTCDWCEPCLVWNAKYQRFMLIYHSATEQALVYRDAAEIDGPWSGAKIIAADETYGAFTAANVLKVDENGDLVIAVTAL